MPDWKNPEDYAYTESLTPTGWAFEFLRRNPKYQADFEKVRALRDLLDEKYGKDTATYLRRVNDPAALITLDAEATAEAQRDPKLRCALRPGPNDETKVHFETFYSRKWGLGERLASPYDVPAVAPRFSVWPVFPFFPNGEDIDLLFHGEDPDDQCTVESWDYAGPGAQRPGVAIVAFDLTEPLSGQVEQAMQELQRRASEQREAGLFDAWPNIRPRFEESRLRKVLRVLDAVPADATKADIYRVLCKDYETKNPTAAVNDWLKQGNALVAERYRLLTIGVITPKI